MINQPSCSSCFNNFSEVTVDQITKLIAKSKPKTSKLDPARTGLIKQSVNIVAPFVTNIINASLTSGIFPTDLKKGLILPLLKKPSFDREELCNYRPITNLTFLSKLTGRVVASQMLAYLQSNSLLSKFQSAYRPLHSTETAILRVITDVKKSYWFSWTCRLRLTPLTMTHFLQDFTLDMESVEQPSHGLDPILMTVINKLSFMAILLVRCLFNLVSLKGLFWDLCCLPCFLLPSKTSFQHMG